MWQKRKEKIYFLGLLNKTAELLYNSRLWKRAADYDDEVNNVCPVLTICYGRWYHFNIEI